MAHIFFTLVLIILPFLSVSQKKKVTECYNTYNHSLELKNPKMAYTKISTSSKSYLENCIYDAGNADSLILGSKTPLYRLLTLYTREILKSSNIDYKKISSEQLFEIIVDNNFIRPLPQSEIINIQIIKDKALSNLKIGNEIYPYNINFIKESIEWKFDITSFFAIEELKFERIKKNTRNSENTIILQRLDNITSMLLIPNHEEGKRYKENPNIWIPLKDL